MKTLIPVRDKPHTQGARLRPSLPSGSSGRCLLVSERQEFLQGMDQAASGAGWDCTWCVRPADSVRQAFLERFTLGIVDVNPDVHRPLLKELLRVLKDTSGGLAIAYDRHADPAAELWSRENGAWLYLPGAADWQDLSQACLEASRVVSKLQSRGLQGATV